MRALEDVRQHVRFLPFLLFFSFFVHLVGAQPAAAPPPHWFLLDPEVDRVQGTSTERAYQWLQGRPARTIVVAVIDSGVDIEHEDLQGKIWVNTKEIPGNGIDDDNNGYVDDVYGWNFIGGKDGNVNEDTHELTREYVRLSKRWGERPPATPAEEKEFADFQRIKNKFEALRDKNRMEYMLYANSYRNLRQAYDTLKSLLPGELTLERLQAFAPESIDLRFAKGYVNRFLKEAESEQGLLEILDDMQSTRDYYQPIAEYAYNEAFDPRPVVGDDPDNLTERFYGNADVKGPDSRHGTHVAGIIAANRQNELGMRGIAEHVLIMPVRAVPNGDERDKDVANAIRYAVDNGAHIINMSFGKSISPHKSLVDEAVRYAEEKGVLLIHAAGNDGRNSDAEPSYPTARLAAGGVARNWIEVGASSWGAGDNLVASFSNYGKKTVNLFAPGVSIYSTTPGNTYERLQGTSMASPVVAGVAALVWAYFPDLSVPELRQVLLESGRTFGNLEVQRPKGGRVRFSELSTSGSIVNAYEAVQRAARLKDSRANRKR